MSEININQNSKNKNKKSMKDDQTNTAYKRPFLLEKIKKDIYKGKYFNLINSNNSDERLMKLKKDLKKKMKYRRNSTSFLKRNDNIYKFINITKYNLKNKSMNNIKNIHPPLKVLRRQRSDFDLPIINTNKTTKDTLLSNKTTLTLLNGKNSLINNFHYFKPKDLLYSNDSRIIKIGSFLNSSKNDNSITESQKLYDINEMNEKFNLKLNLDFKKKKSIIFHGKKYTIIGMLNKLFQYYSHVSNNNKKNNMTSNPDSQTSNYVHYSKSNNSLLNTEKIIIEQRNKNHKNLECNNNTIEALKDTSGDDTNTFITKLNINTTKDKKEKELDITKFIKDRCSLSDVNRRNDEIIESNNKIKIDCLISQIERNISIKKTLYKYLGKTLYDIEKDPSYIRIKEFEKKIINILKKEEL